MTDAIDIKTLKELRANSDMMLRHYGDSEKKQLQNAALVTAGLPPLHSPASLQWDADQLVRYRRFVATLDAVLAHFGADQAEAA